MSNQLTSLKLRHAMLTLVLTAACSPVLPGQSGTLPPLDFEVLFGDNPGGRRPTSLAWSPDGEQLGFFFEDSEGKSLKVFGVESGETRELAREEEAGWGKLSGFHWSPDGNSLLIETEGDLALVAVDDRETRRLTETEADEEDPKFSPGGESITFVRDNDLWLLDLAADTERRLTSGGEADVLLHGKTDWVYWEEIWGRNQVGHWWSPDGSKVAYYRFRVSELGEYSLVDHQPRYPEVTRQKYPKAGEKNPQVEVGVLDLESRETSWLLSTADDDSYLGRVDWLPSGDRLAIQRLNRDQDHLEVLSCAADGSGCALILEETADTWVNLTEDLAFLDDGRFLWTSERSGWKLLSLHAADGSEIRRLTPEGWTTDHVDRLIESKNIVVWTGYETGALGAIHRAVFAQSLDGGDPTALSSREASASATVAADSGRTAIVESTADTPAVAFVVDLSAKRLAELPVEPPEGYDPSELPRWSFLTIPTPDGVRLPAAVLEPAERTSGSRYPVIQYHYGGPASQVVRDAWGSRGRGLWHKMMAARGYGVLMVDNPGSNFFGKSGADRLHRRFGEVNLAAQKAGVEYLRSTDWADAERVGLWGWSGGGSNTLYSLLNAPGTWRAGVSGAPVTNWRFYDTIWTERYLDHPDDNENGYRDSSAVTHAGKLDDALLIVHGTADDNVHPQNTYAMTAALVAANKPFEMAIHPGQKHGFRGQDARHFYERMTRFFDRELSESNP
ncbi:MAG: DPP IV N-terminal domain-containing protein [Thermoanaerobaculia bacterium]